jgi:hydroxymethylbilane synthase
MSSRIITTYATRRSKLALAQSRAFIAQLAARSAGHTFEEKQVVTTGDRIQDRPLSEVGGKGLFVKEIEEALLAGEAQLAVHSIKDVPAVLPDGLAIACIPAREDARDALLSPHQTLAALPRGARVGTSSLRRRLALLRARPDLEILPLRGNVDTRLRKLDEGEFDAIVLAVSGLVRLGLAERITERLSTEVSLPAIGQGALGIECASADTLSLELLRHVDDRETHYAVAAERGVMRALEGDCRTPIAAHCRAVSGGHELRVWVAEPDGSRYREAVRALPEFAASADATEAYAHAYAVGLEVGRALR